MKIFSRCKLRNFFRANSLLKPSIQHHCFFATRSEIAAAKLSLNSSTSNLSVSSEKIRETELIISELLNRIEKGIKDGELEKKNEGFSMQRDGNKLTIDTGKAARSGGTVFTLESDLKSVEPRISMTSFKNSGQGLLNYKFDKKTGHWINESDNHFLLELLVRDLTHHCAGFPIL